MSVVSFGSRRSMRVPPLVRLAMAGFGLIELMIGILIGTILLLGLSQVFSTTRNAYQTTEGMARAQEDGRFAMDYLQHDIRMAGHQGCVNDVSHFQSTPPQFYSHFLNHADRVALNWGNAPWSLQFNNAIEGFDATGTGTAGAVTLAADPVTAGAATLWTPNLPAELVAAVQPPVKGSDVVMVRTFDTSSIPITAINLTVNPVVITVPVADAGKVKAGALFGIADCTKASVFQASSNASAVSGQFTVAGIAGTPSGLNQTGFETGENYVAKELQLFPLRSVAYYVGQTQSGTKGPALMRMNYSNGCGPEAGSQGACTPEELVDGIENMQVMFGYDNAKPVNGSTDVYMTGNQIVTLAGIPAAAGSVDNAWRNVGTVRIAFISRSLDNADNIPALAAAVPKMTLMGVTVTLPPADGRLRQIYTTTIALRNQLFGQ